MPLANEHGISAVPYYSHYSESRMAIVETLIGSPSIYMVPTKLHQHSQQTSVGLFLVMKPHCCSLIITFHASFLPPAPLHFPNLPIDLHSWALQNNSPIFSTYSSHISTFLISLSLITLTCCTSFPTKALTALNTSALLLLNVQPHIQFTTSLSFCFCHLSPCWMPRLPCLLLLSCHSFLY